MVKAKLNIKSNKETNTHTHTYSLKEKRNKQTKETKITGKQTKKRADRTLGQMVKANLNRQITERNIHTDTH